MLIFLPTHPSFVTAPLRQDAMFVITLFLLEGTSVPQILTIFDHCAFAAILAGYSTDNCLGNAVHIGRVWQSWPSCFSCRPLRKVEMRMCVIRVMAHMARSSRKRTLVQAQNGSLYWLTTWHGSQDNPEVSGPSQKDLVHFTPTPPSRLSAPASAMSFLQWLVGTDQTALKRTVASCR